MYQTTALWVPDTGGGQRAPGSTCTVQIAGRSTSPMLHAGCVCPADVRVSSPAFSMPVHLQDAVSTRGRQVMERARKRRSQHSSVTLVPVADTA